MPALLLSSRAGKSNVEDMSPSESPHETTPPVEPSAGGEEVPAQLYKKKQSDLQARIVLSVALALLGGWLLFINLPREISRWYQAAALVAYDRGEFSRAMYLLDRSLALDSKQPEVFARRARWRLDASPPTDVGEEERQKLRQKLLEGSLADSDEAIDLESDFIEARWQRAEALQRLGRHDEAVAECTEVYEILQRLAREHPEHSFAWNLARALNNRAYFRARGNIELEEALADVQLALKLLAASGGANPGDDTLFTFLDTEGYIYYRMGDYEKALTDLEMAVSGATRSYITQLRTLDWQMQITPDEMTYRFLKKQNEEKLAVIYYHRGQIYEAMGREDAAENDFNLAKDLGYDEEAGVW